MRGDMTYFLCINLFILSLAFPVHSFAGEQGHYVPAPMAVRDYVMPPKGFYVVGYDTYYHADSLKDSSGHSIDSKQVTGTLTMNVPTKYGSIPMVFTGTLNADFGFKVNSAMQSVAFVWTTENKILNADYGFMLIPSWGYTSVKIDVQASAAGTVKVGSLPARSFSSGEEILIKDSQMGLGDLVVQPLWLAWRGKPYDVSFSYAVTLPTGAYDKDNIANVGMGFFSQRVQTAVYLYPLNNNKATALMLTPTYEWNSRKIDKNVTPGQTMTIEYGLSQYVHPRVEIGFTGYNQWQISNDTGSAATDKNTKDTVSGIGTHLTYWAIKDRCSITGKVSQEYAAKDRFQGVFGSLNFALIF